MDIAAAPLPTVPGLPTDRSPGVPIGELPGPPAPGSVLDRADMAAVKAAQRLRTPAGDAWAVEMGARGATGAWLDMARDYRGEAGPVQGWLGTALLGATMVSSVAAAHVLKARYERPRPFEADSSITPPFGAPHGSSYPSGHATTAFAAARVLSALQPDRSREVYGLASQVAASRVYAGVHYPSDVVAGALLGTAIADRAVRLGRALTPGA